MRLISWWSGFWVLAGSTTLADSLSSCQTWSRFSAEVMLRLASSTVYRLYTFGPLGFSGPGGFGVGRAVPPPSPEVPDPVSLPFGNGVSPPGLVSGFPPGCVSVSGMRHYADRRTLGCAVSCKAPLRSASLSHARHQRRTVDSSLLTSAARSTSLALTGCPA